MTFLESDIEYRMHTIKHFPSISFKSPLSEHLVLILLWEVTPGVSSGKESPSSAGDLGSVPGLGRSPGEGNGLPTQYSCFLPGEFSGQRRQAGYSPWGHKELDMTE